MESGELRASEWVVLSSCGISEVEEFGRDGQFE